MVSQDPAQANPTQCRMHWVDRRGLSCNATVELATQSDDTAIVLSDLPFEVATPVYLSNSHFPGNGRVESCIWDQNRYRTVIRWDSTEGKPAQIDFDPGVLALNAFMTEEDEDRILAQLAEEVEEGDQDSRETLLDSLLDTDRVRRRGASS